MCPSESLRGARVLVTGASTGIGEQMAYHYASFGAQIVITARREKVLQQVSELEKHINGLKAQPGVLWLFVLQLRGTFNALILIFASQVVEKCLSLGAQRALYIAADMGNESDPDKVIDFALEKLGGLDYVVLNHIGPSPFSMWEGDVEHTRWLMKVVQHSDLGLSSTHHTTVMHWSLSLSLPPLLCVCVCVCVCACFPKVNFFSYIQMAWRAMASLEQNKGSLVIVSSLLGWFNIHIET